MQFSPPLQPATLIKRYKRFLADVVTPAGDVMLYPLADIAPMLIFPDGEALADRLALVPPNGLTLWDHPAR